MISKPCGTTHGHLIVMYVTPNCERVMRESSQDSMMMTELLRRFSMSNSVSSTVDRFICLLDYPREGNQKVMLLVWSSYSLFILLCAVTILSSQYINCIQSCI